MKILSLTAENVKRLIAVEISPAGAPVVVIAGENEAGKSSVIDAIEMVLGGEKRLPPEPIRRGQSKARVVADLGDMIVTRTFTASGGGSLTVTNRDGARYPSPQALLDGLVGKLSFDPLAFATMKPDAQAATLRALAHIDTTTIELDRKAKYDARTAVNRDLTSAQATLATMPHHADVGSAPETFDALTTELARADELAASAAAADRAMALAKQALAAKRADATRCGLEVLQLRERLEAAEASEESAQMAAATASDHYAACVATADATAKAVPDRTALRQSISEIEARNRRIAENGDRIRRAASVAALKKASDDLTADIARLDSEKAAMLTNATFPLTGLGLTDDGVTWNGLPFAQASTAIRTRVSVAIGLALNPKLKVLLIRNGNDLDAKNLALLAETAKEAGAQLWLERIAGGNGQHTIVIEDGAVQGVAQGVA